MIDTPRRMAQRLHAKLTEDVARRQREVVMDELVLAAFGDDALPAETMLHGAGILSRRGETVRGLIADRRQRITEDLEAIRDIEALLAEVEEADLKAFAQAMGARMRAEQKGRK